MAPSWEAAYFPTRWRSLANALGLVALKSASVLKKKKKSHSSINCIYYSKGNFYPQNWKGYIFFVCFKENHLSEHNPCTIISWMRSRTKVLEHGGQRAEVEVSFYWRCSTSSGMGYHSGRSTSPIVEVSASNTDTRCKVDCPRCMGSSGLILLRIQAWMSNSVSVLWQLDILDVRQPCSFS